MLTSLVGNRWFQGAAKTAVLFAFLLVFLDLAATSMLGPSVARKVVWLVWWPAFPLVYLLVGRAWCAVCPFATLGDFARAFRRKLRPAPRWLERRGTWVAVAGFFVLTWATEAFGFEESRSSTLWLLLGFAAGSVGLSLFFQNRVWCRYLCPLGNISAIYARAGAVALVPKPGVCRGCPGAECHKGSPNVPACPLFRRPRSASTMGDCNLCGHCVEACGRRSLEIRLRPPTSELWRGAPSPVEDPTVAALALGILVAAQLPDGAFGWFGLSSPVLQFTLRYLFGTAACLALFLGAAWCASVVSRRSAAECFRVYGPALIPLALFAHLAQGLGELLGHEGFFREVVSAERLRHLQGAVGFFGAAATGYCLFRIAVARRAKRAGRGALPFGAAAAVSAVGLLFVHLG